MLAQRSSARRSSSALWASNSSRAWYGSWQPATWIWPSISGGVLDASKPPASRTSLAALDTAAITEGSSTAMGMT